MSQSFLAKIAKLRIFGKSPVNAYLRLNRLIWNHLPPSLTGLPPIHSYGIFLHALARLSAVRTQNVSTFFLRNRPELELIRRISDQRSKGATLKILVLACSKGAEVYSILWTIRSARPDLKVMTCAVDISKEVLEFAQMGVYSLTTPEFIDVPIFERMSTEEMRDMFDIEGDKARVKLWLKEGISWQLGDAGDPKLFELFGSHDIVIANRFLCHMDPSNAERCLRNIGRLIKPGGYIFVSGVDLEVRTKVASGLGWKPVLELMEAIHNGDPSLRDSWPCGYWGLEPFNNLRSDWEVRYASCFELPKES